MQAFFKALSDEPDTTLRDYFAALLLTGARRSNVLAMRWEDIDLERGIWRVAAEQSKSGKPLVVMLAQPAILLLQQRMQRVDGSEWVFPSNRSKTGHVEDPKIAWARILKRGGLKNLRMHDLRRTLGSWAAGTGASLPIIGRVLGHTDQSTTAIYARLDTDPIKNAVETATAAMLAAGGDLPGLVADDTDGGAVVAD